MYIRRPPRLGVLESSCVSHISYVHSHFSYLIAHIDYHISRMGKGDDCYADNQTILNRTSSLYAIICFTIFYFILLYILYLLMGFIPYARVHTCTHKYIQICTNTYEYI